MLVARHHVRRGVDGHQAQQVVAGVAHFVRHVLRHDRHAPGRNRRPLPAHLDFGARAGRRRVAGSRPPARTRVAVDPRLGELEVGGSEADHVPASAMRPDYPRPPPVIQTPPRIPGVGAETFRLYGGCVVRYDLNEMTVESVVRGERRDGTESRVSADGATWARRRAELGLASELRAARRRADLRHEQVVTEWLRRLDEESGPAPR
jgi:hypothetical protein